MITAVDLLRGLAALVGWDRIEVEGATGYLDTNYAGKGQAAIDVSPTIEKKLTDKQMVQLGEAFYTSLGMPALVYRWLYRAHSVKSLERNILGFVGFAPVHETLIGGTGTVAPERAKKLLAQMRRLGSDAA